MSNQLFTSTTQARFECPPTLIRVFVLLLLSVTTASTIVAEEVASSRGHQPKSRSVSVHTSEKTKREEIRMGMMRGTFLSKPMFIHGAAVATVLAETEDGRPKNKIAFSLHRMDVRAIEGDHEKPTVVCADKGGRCEDTYYRKRTPSYMDDQEFYQVKGWKCSPKQVRQFIAFLDDFTVAAVKNEKVTVRENLFKVEMRKVGGCVFLDPDDNPNIYTNYLGTFREVEEIPPVVIDVKKLRSLLTRMMTACGESMPQAPKELAKLVVIQEEFQALKKEQRKQAEKERHADNERLYRKAIKEKKAYLNRQEASRKNWNINLHSIPMASPAEMERIDRMLFNN